MPQSQPDSGVLTRFCEGVKKFLQTLPGTEMPKLVIIFFKTG